MNKYELFKLLMGKNEEFLLGLHSFNIVNEFFIFMDELETDLKPLTSFSKKTNSIEKIYFKVKNKKDKEKILSLSNEKIKIKYNEEKEIFIFKLKDSDKKDE